MEIVLVRVGIWKEKFVGLNGDHDEHANACPNDGGSALGAPPGGQPAPINGGWSGNGAPASPADAGLAGAACAKAGPAILIV